MASRALRTNETPTKLAASAVSTLKVATINANIEIHADYAVWDTVNNKFLVEGKDYSTSDLFRR